MSCYIDVFNGDADGICALIQLRLSKPQESVLISGPKRDINLLKNLTASEGDHVTVLDISFEKNSEDIIRLLGLGVTIDYFDHHRTGKLLVHENIQYRINLSKNTCTSLIVDQELQGRYRDWALTGAFGDNLIAVAKELALSSGLNHNRLLLLKSFGTYLNYNGYGSSSDDLLYEPSKLYKKLVNYSSPFDFINDDKETFDILERTYEDDLSKALLAPIKYQTKDCAIIILPNEKWARRISGVFNNILTNKYPDRAHAVLIEQDNDDFVASIRAPLNRQSGADCLASEFPSGGGRTASAGINSLSSGDLTKFIDAMQEQFKI